MPSNTFPIVAITCPSCTFLTFFEKNLMIMLRCFYRTEIQGQRLSRQSDRPIFDFKIFNPTKMFRIMRNYNKVVLSRQNAYQQIKVFYQIAILTQMI